MSSFRGLRRQGRRRGAAVFHGDAWNANAAVLSVPVGHGGAKVPAVTVPENDDFAHALAIEGAKGSSIWIW